MSESGKKNLSPDFCEVPLCPGIPGYLTIVQRHRIIPGREGGKYRKGNVISLCGSHHVLADRGAIPAEALLEIVRIRLEKEEVGKQTTIDLLDQQGDPSPPPSGDHPASESDEGSGYGTFHEADGYEPECSS